MRTACRFSSGDPTHLFTGVYCAGSINVRFIFGLHVTNLLAVRTGFGSINYRDILQYIALGDKRLSQELNDDDDEDDVDKGVWGASPIVDIQLSTSDLEEVSSHEEPHI